MVRPLAQVRKVVSRWARREESYLRHQFNGKTVRDRLHGLRRSERNKAKYFFLALAPAALIGPFVGKWSDASVFGKAVLALTGAWTVFVLLAGSYLAIRAAIRASRGRSEQ